jgi:hypothetical protein
MGNKYVKDLPCAMTDDEKRLKGIALAQAVEEKRALDAEKKEWSEEHKSRVGRVDTRIFQLSHQVTTGRETRAVDCAEYERYPAHMVDLVRLDSGEVVFSRPMRPDELQTSMEMQQDGAEEGH